MPIEEMVEEKAQSALIQVAEGGARLTVRVSADIAKALLRSGWSLARTGTGTAAGAVRHRFETGRVSEAKLQSLGKDTHVLQLDDDTLKEVARSLRQAGITYSIEQTKDGRYWLHFIGKDRDHVLHAVNRALEKMGITFDQNTITTEERAADERTRDTEQPRQEQPRTSSAPAGTTPDTPREQAGPEQMPAVDWLSVSPTVMESAVGQYAAEHPEVSWDTLMPGREMTPEGSEEWTVKARDIIRTDPDARKEFDRLLHDRFGQEYTTTAPAGRPAATTPLPQPGTSTTPDGKPLPSTTTNVPLPRPEQTATPARTEDGKPKIRDKQALFDRFKTRLRSNLKDNAGRTKPTPVRTKPTPKPSR